MSVVINNNDNNTVKRERDACDGKYHLQCVGVTMKSENRTFIYK